MERQATNLLAASILVSAFAATLLFAPRPTPPGGGGGPPTFRVTPVAADDAVADPALLVLARPEDAGDDLTVESEARIASILRQGRPLTPELVDRCLEVAEMLQPELATKLRALREADPTTFERRLRQSTRLLALADLKQRDPRLFDMKLVELRVDAEVARLAREVRRAHVEGSAAERQSLEVQLLGQVRLQVAFGIVAREDFLCRLQDEVRKLEEALARDKRHPDALVDERLRDLLGDTYHPGVGTAR